VRQHFWKYQATGNDFIVIDEEELRFDLKDEDIIRSLCQRHLGIGSDGILVLAMQGDALNIEFLNPDGSRSFCGNGSRAAVRFAQEQEWIGHRVGFKAIDGSHEAQVVDDGIRISMRPVQYPVSKDEGEFLDTGSPHLVLERDDVKVMDVKSLGAEVRYSEEWTKTGVNVNFLESCGPEHIYIRTYERGVEAETLSCGTGVTAAALYWANKQDMTEGRIQVDTLGGVLTVGFERNPNGFDSIYLEGPAKRVFEGFIEL
jgi:diaminopimelate epimerase